MDEPTYDGPRIGDVVVLEVTGTVVEMASQDGTPGVVVSLVSGGDEMFRQLADVQVLYRKEEAPYAAQRREPRA